MVEVLYEDPHLVVVNKPSGMLTQPDDTGRGSIQEELRAFIKERDQKPGNVFLEATHRLDRPVGGIVVFAKRSKALARAQKDVRDLLRLKKYYALVEGAPDPKSGLLKHQLVHDDFIARVVSKGGKEARLSYETVAERKGKSLLDVTLETGRYHQIRVQLGTIGCPILGDQKYGASKADPLIALFHYFLEMPHPMSRQVLTFTVECPWANRFRQ